jgi:hypothetical protein
VEAWPNAPDWLEERATSEGWADDARMNRKFVACLTGWHLVPEFSGEQLVGISAHSVEEPRADAPIFAPLSKNEHLPSPLFATLVDVCTLINPEFGQHAGREKRPPPHGDSS